MATVARVPAALVALMVASGSIPYSLHAQSPSDEQAIRSLRPGPGAYTDDSFFFSGAYGRPIIGRPTAPPDRGGERKNFKQEEKIEKLVVSKSGDLAYAHGTATLSWEGREPFDAAFLRVYRKEGGKWKIAALFQRPLEDE